MSTEPTTGASVPDPASPTSSTPHPPSASQQQKDGNAQAEKERNQQGYANLIQHYKELLTQRNAEMQDMKDELAERNLQMKKLQSSQTTQVSIINEKEKELAVLLDRLTKAHAMLQEKQHEDARLAKEVGDRQFVKEQYYEMQKEKGGLEQSIEELRNYCDKMEAETEKLNERQHAVEGTFQDLRECNDELSEQIRQHHMYVIKLNNQIRGVEQEKSRLKRRLDRYIKRRGTSGTLETDENSQTWEEESIREEVTTYKSSKTCRLL